MSEKQTALAQLLPFAKIGSVLAFIGGALATFNHFAGYSYLKGRLEGMGLGLREIEISQQEITFQTTLFLRDFHQSTLKDTSSLLGMGLWPTVFFILIGGVFVAMMFPKGQKQVSENSSEKPDSNDKLRKMPNWLKRINEFFKPAYPYLTPVYSFLKRSSAYLSLFTIGFYGLVLVFVTFLSYLAGGLSMAYEYGLKRGQSDIASDVCVSIDMKEKKTGRLAGCSTIYGNGSKEFIGRVIHKSNKLTVMVTNTESFILDDKGNFLACSPIINPSKTADEHKQNNCLVR
ncbi:hypothetical protein [Pseudoalteromonas gelatinilytica]|uniref:DUF3592 domain-containing protein n=1 Tax=Pseudoalteromonas gelatinilytica TaxID=1703256 RepID=A0ABQ1T4V6_9GAMM|nr:hypothetical protein [Pseudoalteromonas profundi]GGE82218.1 hypothetical protein GCM10008027_03620 [Pseudoalteromonas profundi]